MTYLTKLGLKSNFLNLIKNSYKKPIANILSGKRLEALTLKMNKCYHFYRQHYTGSPS